MNIDKDYIGWIEELKSRYRRAQIKAAVKVNAEQLRFNWQLGRDLVIRKAEEKWGSGFVEQVSMDLQAAFPESKGFSTVKVKEIQDQLPSVEELTKRIRLLEEQLSKEK